MVVAALAALLFPAGPWTLATIPAVGTVAWRCDGDRYALSFHAFRDSATDEVTYQGVTRAVQPGKWLRFPASHAFRQRVTFVQSTEPGTLRATVDVDFRPRPVSPSHCAAYLPPGVIVRVSPR